MKMNKIKLVTLFCICFSFYNVAAQNKIELTQRAIGNLQAVINESVKGDTIVFPAGKHMLGSTIYLSQKGLVLKGDAQNKTIVSGLKIKGDTSHNMDAPAASEPSVTIANLTFEGGEPLEIENTVDFRVTNCNFLNQEDGISVKGASRGVIDHCYFDNISRYGISIIGDGDATWSKPLELGTEDAVFVEDCTMKNSSWHHVASNNGSKYVFRYNYTEDDRVGHQAIDSHGLEFWPRGSRSIEVYNNTLKANRRYLGVKVRGGDGVIFNNSFEGDFGYPVQLMNDVRCNNYPEKDQIRSLYIWSNTHNGGNAEVDVDCDLIQLNRDYYLSPMPGYEPYPYPHPLTGVDPGDLPIRINTTSLSNAINGENYDETLSASQGEQPYQWRIIQGNLPNGLSLSGNSISGTVNATPGSYDFTVEATDASGESATRELSIEVVANSFSSIPYFGEMANWEPNQPGLWTAATRDNDTRYIITTSDLSTSNSALAAYSLVKNRNYDNFTLTMNVKSSENFNENEAADYAVVFGYQDDNNYYYMLFNTTQNWNALYRMQDGTRSEIAIASTSLITDNNYHVIEVSVQNSFMTVRKDQANVFSSQVPGLQGGRVGIGSLNDIAYFDDININLLDSDTVPPAAPSNVEVSASE